jgi:hypothetical protein
LAWSGAAIAGSGGFHSGFSCRAMTVRKGVQCGGLAALEWLLPALGRLFCRLALCHGQLQQLAGQQYGVVQTDEGRGQEQRDVF